MLRIVEEKATDGSTTLRLDGRIVSQWVDVLRSSCEQVIKNEMPNNDTKKSHLILDLTGVSFADHEGIRLLQQLEQRKVTFINCSPFLQEQVKQTADRLFTESQSDQ